MDFNVVDPKLDDGEITLRHQMREIEESYRTMMSKGDIKEQDMELSFIQTMPIHLSRPTRTFSIKDHKKK
jgi:hypothetical protein